MPKRIRLCSNLLLVFIILTVVTLAACQKSAAGDPSAGTEPPVTEDEGRVAVSTEEPRGTETPEPVQSVRIGTDLPISRAMAAKMLACVIYDKATIDAMEMEAVFADVGMGEWYAKYVNAVYLAGIMSGGDGLFMPDNPLTMMQARYLLDSFAPGNGAELLVFDEIKDTPIAYSLWVDLFIQAIEYLGGGDAEGQMGVARVQAITLATANTDSKVPEGSVVTATGQAGCAGIDMNAYVDKEITVLKKDGEIIALYSVDDNAPVIKNAYVTFAEEGRVTIFSGGVERTYPYEGGVLTSGSICDIKVMDGTALSVTAYRDVVNGTVKRLNADYSELLDIGRLVNDRDVKVYDVSGNSVGWKGMSSVIVGSDMADFVVEGGIVRAILIRKSASIGDMRVCISTTGFEGYIHDSVSLTSDVPYTVWAGGVPLKYDAYEVFSVSSEQNADLFGNPRIYVTVDVTGGRIQLQSVSRNWPGGEKPWYRGFMEVALEPDGRFTIVNELPIEQYLYSVVPSEMPTSHGLEAAKVQAVTARSYAYNQYFANGYYKYGANIDDSVMCQVYNNIPENDTSIAACDQTAGMCLAYGGSVISANFFSTSAGVTANSGEVWANSSTRQFPSATSAYLKSVKQYTGASYGDLRVEPNAAAFFKDISVSGYDSQFSWFRWNVEMTAAELAASINAALESRYDANPSMIKTLQPNGVYRSRPISSIGKLVDLEVVERGEGGNIMCLKITGTESAVMVYTELNVRYLLKPAKVLPGGRDIVINRITGGGVSNFSLLPSAFAVFDKNTDEQGNLQSVTFYGGGYGHGVGMSQNGVKGMIDAGFGFEQILKHYYNGTAIIKKW